MIDFAGAEEEAPGVRREYPDAPRVGVGAIVVRDGKVLLAHRATSPGKGGWSLPGGIVELGEEMRDAVERELLEECGITVEVGPPVDVFDRIESDEQGETRYHYVIIDFLVESFAGEPRAASDVDDVKWADPSELESFGIPKPVRRIIEHAVRLSSA